MHVKTPDSGAARSFIQGAREHRSDLTSHQGKHLDAYDRGRRLASLGEFYARRAGTALRHPYVLLGASFGLGFGAGRRFSRHHHNAMLLVLVMPLAVLAPQTAGTVAPRPPAHIVLVSAPASHIPARTATGNHAICRPQRVGQACLTRTDNGTTGTRNRLYFRNGIRAYGGYWTIKEIGHVGGSWPFKYSWANTRWRGWAVVEHTTYTFGNQYASGKCRDGAHITVCLERASTTTYWVQVKKSRKYWLYVSVKATDDIYPLTGRRTSYVLQYNGVGRIAITAPNTGGRHQLFSLPGV